MTFDGEINLVHFDHSANDHDCDWSRSGDLKQALRSQALDLNFAYPSALTDITAAVTTQATRERITFRYVTPALSASDRPVFTADVLENSADFRRLGAVRAKILLRIYSLEREIARLQGRPHRNPGEDRKLALYAATLTELRRTVDEIALRLNESPELIARIAQPLIVGNSTAEPLTKIARLGPFSLATLFDVGAAHHGTQTSIHGSITQVNDQDVTDDKSFAAQFYWKNVLVHSTAAQDFDPGTSVEFDLPTTGTLLPSGQNTFTEKLVRYKRGRSAELWAQMDERMLVTTDTVAPQWQAGSSLVQQPTSAQSLLPISAVISDAFGRLNLGSFHAVLTGPAGAQDVTSRLGITSSDGGLTAQVSGDFNPLDEGVYTLSLTLCDLAGLSATLSSHSFRIDRTPPNLVLGIQDHLLTRTPQLLLPITATDASTTQISVALNGATITSGPGPYFAPTLDLIEGMNTVEVIATDAAGNVATVVLIDLTLDTTPPVLSHLSPAPNSIQQSLSFTVSGQSNEPLQAAQFRTNSTDAQILAIAPDRMSFAGTVSLPAQGMYTIYLDTVDLAGNTTTQSTTVEIILNVLSGHLLSVVPSADRLKLEIRGAPGATRPGITVQASANFINRGSAVGAADGSFVIALDPFTEAEVTATDATVGRTDTVTVYFGSNAPTLLSGVVKDTSGNPLPGVAVSLKGSSAQVLTDSAGMFAFQNGIFGPNIVPTGDQQLVVDGTVLGPVAIGNQPVMNYSKAHLTVFIGLNQSNVMPAPIFLQGIPASVAAVDNSVGIVTVTAANDPSVGLRIPAGAAHFADGTSVGAIYMNRTAADVVAMPVPQYSQPDTVIHLEPSGLTFSERAELVLPNENHLPAGVQLVIMSMNSTKGIWEIDGLAEVSSSGNEVRTLPGAGISHFSTVYASPMAPKVSPIGAADVPGADAFNGALTTQIKMPSQKVMGQDVAPTLLYKSAWARPTAMVSNLFQIPRGEFHYDTGIQIKLLTIFFNMFTQDEFRSWYQPNRIVGSFNTAGITGQPVTFPGPPNSVQLSYATELRSPASGDYLNSSVYPYTSHWDVYLDHVSTHTRRELNTIGIVPVHYSETNYPVEVDQIKQAFPSDLNGTILVENQRRSSVGSGWKIAGVQQIANPQDGRIMIQEGDGSLSTYAVSNTIDTVADAAGTDVDFGQGVDLSQLPHVTASASDGGLRRADISPASSGSPVSSFSTVGQPFVTGGTIWGNSFGQTGFFNLAYFCHYDSYSYAIRNKTQQLISAPSGEVFGTSDNLSALLSFNSGGTGTFSGIFTTVPTFQYGDYPQQIANYCASTPGMTCNHGQSIRTGGAFGTGSRDCPWRASFGAAPYATFNGDGSLGSVAWNHPMGVSAGPRPNTLVVADYGNFRVRVIDLATGLTTTVAGDGGYYPSGWADSGDGGPATSAHVYHPKGVVYDAIGNLYISQENGAVRKVDTLGNISTIIGGPTATPRDALTPATEVSLGNPYGMAVDNVRGYLYIAETTGNTVKRYHIATGRVETVAGNGQAAAFGDGGAALNAALNRPTHLGLDGDGSLYVVDSGNQRIRRVSFGAGSAATTLAYAPTAQDHSTLVRSSDGTFVRGFRNGIQVSFNADGTQNSVTDRAGRTTAYDYDTGVTPARLTRITYPTGQYTQFNYSGTRLASVSDSSGRAATTLSQDGSNNLTAVTYPDGTRKQYGYNALGLLTAETNESGHTAQYAYNEWNRLASVTLPDAAHSVLAINDSASATAANNYNGSQMPKAFGGPGQAEDKIVDPRSNTTTFSKDKKGFISTIVDALGNRVTIERDLRGKPVHLTRYDVSGNTLSEATYEYDSNNPNPARRDDLLSQSDTATGITTSQTYDDFGNVLTRTSGRGLTATSHFDPVTGLLLAQTDPLGHSVSQTYTALGLVLSKTDALNRTSTLTYDSNGNVTAATSPTGSVSARTLDGAGNAITTTDANGKITHMTYDVFNRLTSVTTPNGKTTSYAYTAAGQLASVTDPLGKLTTYEYDGVGNLIRKIDPLGQALTRTYDGSGNVIGEIDPNGNVKTFSYDAANRLLQKTLPDNVIAMTYDAHGNVSRAQDNLTQVNQTYDVAGRLLTTQVVGQGALAGLPANVLTYGYDADSNRVSMTAATGVTTYSYDNGNRLTSVNNPYSEVYAFDFDAASRLTGITRPGSTSVLSWDNSNFLTSLAHNSNGGATLASFGYQLDFVGNRTSITTGRGTASATYDANYQLTALTNPEVSSSFASEAFSYDSNANRATDQNGTYNYDNAAQRLIQDWQNFYFYDNNGNLISKQGKGLNGHVTAYRYSSENQLIGFTEYAPTGIDPSGYIAVPSNPIKHVSYFYDATGRRVRKQVQDLLAPSDVTRTFTRQFVYDGQEILDEYDGSGSLLAHYTHSGLRTDDMLAVRVTSAGATARLAQNSGSYQYLKDAQGTVMDVADNSGNKLQHYIYSAFGILLGIEDANAADISSNPALNTSFGYTGREKDSESGLMYYRARYYDPNVGRFLQRDPEPGRMDIPASVINAYTYVANNPLNLLDPTGRDFWGALGSIVAGVAIAVGTVALIVFTAGAAAPAIAAAVGGGLGGALAAGAVGAGIGAGIGAAGGALAGGFIGGGISLAKGGSFGAGFAAGAGAGAIIGAIIGASIGFGAGFKGGLNYLKAPSQVSGGGYAKPIYSEVIIPNEPGLESIYSADQCGYLVDAAGIGAEVGQPAVAIGAIFLFGLGCPMR